MTDAQLLKEYVRVRLTPARIMIEVRVVTPEDENGKTSPPRWSLAAALPKLSLATTVERTRLMVAADRRYFRGCDNCHERHPVGRITSLENGTELCRDCLADEKDGD